jgi:glycopeptide antibiotics resistance protein
LGAFIYILFRPSEHLFFSWFAYIGLDDWFDSIRYHSLSQSLHIPGWIVFSLPNGLWAFSYALLITTIWSDSHAWIKYLWLASIPVLVIGFEVLQYTGTIHGTFCIQDMALGILGIILGYLVGIKLKTQKNHEKASEQ